MISSGPVMTLGQDIDDSRYVSWPSDLLEMDSVATVAPL